MTTLAHVSDLHATPVEVRRVADFLGKRALGWLSWRLRRRHHHRPEALEALAADLRATAPDHTAVTGDVTNDLTSLVADPNVTIHEGKAFMCNVEKA